LYFKPKDVSGYIYKLTDNKNFIASESKENLALILGKGQHQKEIELNDNIISIIVGNLLGDGHASRPYKNGVYTL
jgi:hypothetical protein